VEITNRGDELFKVKAQRWDEFLLSWWKGLSAVSEGILLVAFIRIDKRQTKTISICVSKSCDDRYMNLCWTPTN